MRKTLFLFVIIIGACHRNPLPPIINKVIVNGDFEQELNVGWQRNVSGLNYSDEIARYQNLDGDDDFELVIEKINAGHIKLYQTIDFAASDYQFSAKANLKAIEYNSNASYWAAAAICLRYLNDSQELLGETRIVFKTPHCPWQNTNNLHLINAISPDQWYNYSFKLSEELANLSGVNIADIKKIQIVVMDTTNGC